MLRWTPSELWDFRCTTAEQVFFIGRVVMMFWEVQRQLLPHHVRGALGSSEVELRVSGVFQPSPHTLSHC